MVEGLVHAAVSLMSVALFAGWIKSTLGDHERRIKELEDIHPRSPTAVLGLHRGRSEET